MTSFNNKEQVSGQKGFEKTHWTEIPDKASFYLPNPDLFSKKKRDKLLSKDEKKRLSKDEKKSMILECL